MSKNKTHWLKWHLHVMFSPWIALSAWISAKWVGVEKGCGFGEWGDYGFFEDFWGGGILGGNGGNLEGGMRRGKIYWYWMIFKAN